MVSEIGALGKHLALIGFMGAGKTTAGQEVAERTGRPFVDTDQEIERRHGPIPELFERGEAEFRHLEEQVVAEALAGPDAVIALGGGAILSEATRERLRAQAFTVWLDVDVDAAWERVRGSDRPLAQREEDFRRLFETRRPLYVDVMDAPAGDSDEAVLAALHVFVAQEVVYGGSYVVVADERVLSLHPFEPGHRIIELPPGEQAKTLAVVERLWRDIDLDREGTIVAVGGGSTTDVVGFAAATYKRGVGWAAIPTTLTGMVDAAIGGKTGINTTLGKNLAGAFHFPQAVFIQREYLTTLPEEERRAGMAEVVKTGLLAGEPLWELSTDELVRRCAAYKAAICLRDPCERGERAVLNLVHTFAHALEAAGDYHGPSHAEAVALGLLAALRLSDQDTAPVEEVLQPRPVRVDRDAAWAALARDKKSVNGSPRLVLLEAPGKPVTGVELPEQQIREALDALIAE